MSGEKKFIRVEGAPPDIEESDRIMHLRENPPLSGNGTTKLDTEHFEDINKRIDSLQSQTEGQGEQLKGLNKDLSVFKSKVLDLEKALPLQCDQTELAVQNQMTVFIQPMLDRLDEIESQLAKLWEWEDE